MHTNPKLKLNRIRDFGEIFSDTFAMLKQVIKVLAKSILFYLLPIIIIISIFYANFMSKVLAISADPGNFGADNGIMLGLFYAVVILFSIISTIIYMGIVNGIILNYENEENPENITRENVWAFFKKNVGRLLKATLAFIGVFLIVMLLFAGLVGGGIALIDSAGAGAGAAAFIVFLLLLIVMGFLFFFFFGHFMMFWIVYLKEGTTIMGAIRRTYDLIKGHWLPTFGVALIFSIIGGACYSIVYMPFMIVEQVISLNSIRTGESPSIFITIFRAIGYAVAMFSSFIAYSVVYIGIGLQYFNLLEIKSGSGMSEMIDSIGTFEKEEDPENQGDY